MKRINIAKMLKENSLDYKERTCLLGMEFIKLLDGNYLIKDSNGRVVSEKEKLQLEKGDLIFKDFKSNKCQKETKKKIEKIDKKLKEVEEPKDEDIEEAKPIKE